MNRRVRVTALRVAVHLVNTGSNAVGDDVLSRGLRRLLLRLCGAQIPWSSTVHGGTHLSRPANLRMGERCFINRNCYLDLEASVSLGDDVVVGHGTTIVTSSHALGPPSRRAGLVTGHPVVIESGSWLGANTVILPGVTIGSGAVIAAGAVVTADVPANVIMAGIPAQVLRHLEAEPGDTGLAGLEWPTASHRCDLG